MSDLWPPGYQPTEQDLDDVERDLRLVPARWIVTLAMNRLTDVAWDWRRRAATIRDEPRGRRAEQ